MNLDDRNHFVGKSTGWRRRERMKKYTKEALRKFKELREARGIAPRQLGVVKKNTERAEAS